MEYQITLLPGDGIGQQVIHETIRVMQSVVCAPRHTF